jgi:hypothetical protein
MSKGCGKRARLKVRTNGFSAREPREPMWGMPCNATDAEAAMYAPRAPPREGDGERDRREKADV